MSRAPILPVGSSWNVGGDKVEKARRQHVERLNPPCSICRKRGHNRKTCPQAAEVLKRVREQVRFVQAEKNPFEWERLKPVKEALLHIAKLSTGRHETRGLKALRAERAEVAELAQLALVAWNGGKK